MKKKFITNLLFLIFVNLLVKPFYIFGIDRTVQNVVGTEEFGLYFAIFNFSYIFQIILDFGIQYYNNRSISQHSHLLPKFLPNILFTKALLAIIYLIITFVIAFGISFTDLQMKLLLFLAFNNILISLIMYLRSNISALQHFRTDSLISILDKLLMILIVGAMLWFLPIRNNFRIELFVYAQTASYIVTFLVCLLLVNRQLSTFSFQLNRPLLLLILKKSYPYAIAVFLMSLYNKIDGVMIEQLLPEDGAHEAGIYAAAYRILDAVNMLGFLFASLLLPIYAKMIQNKEPLQDLVITGFKSIFIIGLIISINSWFFRNEIMELLYIEADPYYGKIYGLLIFSFLAVGTMYIFGSLLTANGNLLQMNLLFIVCVILNIIMNYYLILTDKAFGASVATIITQSIVAVGEIIMVYYFFKIKIPLIQVLKFIIFAAIIIGINYIALELQLLWTIKFIGVVAVSSLAALFFGLFDVQNLLKITTK